ncbi:transposase [Streptomyces sp. NPDC049687]|uniref:transposase n=1 Tax=Streptomyces sp. NPDC049687 TaxID=3365596 RepID=UPI0037AB594F
MGDPTSPGPIGLATAAHLIERDIEPLVLEAGPSAGTAVRDWAHVRLFSPWSEVIDPAAEKLLAPTGWVRPDGVTYPTGVDWAERYLQPLADVLGDKVRYGATVIGVARAGRDRIVDAGRDEQPFTVHIQTADGREERIIARAVIDASGTWSTPSPMGADGLPALGEKSAADRCGGEADELPARGALGLRAKAAVDEDAVARATRITLRLLAERIEQLTVQIDELNQRLTGLVERHAPQLLAPVGIGPDSAVTLLITMGDNPERLSTEASFAALCGVSPIEYSSGQQNSRRLNHGGDRQANAALHRIVFTRLRHDPSTQAYYERRTQEGKTRREIIRCLKRYAAREVFNLVPTASTDPPL